MTFFNSRKFWIFNNVNYSSSTKLCFYNNMKYMKVTEISLIIWSQYTFIAIKFENYKLTIWKFTVALPFLLLVNLNLKLKCIIVAYLLAVCLSGWIHFHWITVAKYNSIKNLDSQYNLVTMPQICVCSLDNATVEYNCIFYFGTIALIR